MGYSATVAACDTFDAWNRACLGQGSVQNSYQEWDGPTRYFYEIGREQDDGSITGSVFRYIHDGLAVRAGSFKIAADGAVVRWPAKFRQFWQMEGAWFARKVDA